MLSKIERERAAIEKRLRQGWVLCFGSGYRCAEGDPIAARQMLDALWGVARDNNQQEDFIREAKKNGIGFLPDVVLKDLFRNRLDYPMLQRRASKRK
jgi:hypothetical protein